MSGLGYISAVILSTAVLLLASRYLGDVISVRIPIQNWEKYLFGFMTLAILFFLAALSLVLFLIAFSLGLLILIFVPKLRHKCIRLLIPAAITLYAAFSPIFSSHSMQGALGYWHSGNGDIFDGLHGALSILLDQKDGITIMGNAESRVYVSGPGGLQYSTLALMAALHGRVPTVWDFFVLGILGLVAQYFAVKSFAARVFMMTAKSAAATSAFSVLGQFYFVTFLNGHIGTLMASPALVWLLTHLYQERRKTHKGQTVLTVLYVVLAYPYYTPFLLLFVIERLGRRLLRPRLWRKVYTIVIAVLFTSSWFLLASIRSRAEETFRAWGTIFTPMAPLQVVGLAPGQVAFSRITYRISTIIGTPTFLEIVLLVGYLGLIASLITIGGRFILRTRPDLAGFFILILTLPLTIGLTSRDSYYTYKALYSFFFILVCVASLAIMTIAKDFHRRFSIPILSITIVPVLSTNIIYGVWESAELVENNRSAYSLAEQALAIPKDRIERPIVMFDKSPPAYLFEYISRVRGADLTSTPETGVWMSSDPSHKHFEVRWLAPDTMRLGRQGIGGREAAPSDTQFRWIYPSRIPGTRLFGVVVQRLNPSNRDARIELCMSLAPWIKETKEIRAVALAVTNEKEKLALLPSAWTETAFSFEKKYLARVEVSQDRKCSILTIPAGVESFGLISQQGVSPSIWDNRRILYRIWDTKNDIGALN